MRNSPTTLRLPCPPGAPERRTSREPPLVGASVASLLAQHRRGLWFWGHIQDPLVFAPYHLNRPGGLERSITGFRNGDVNWSGGSPATGPPVHRGGPELRRSPVRRGNQAVDAGRLPHRARPVHPATPLGQNEITTQYSQIGADFSCRARSAAAPACRRRVPASRTGKCRPFSAASTRWNHRAFLMIQADGG